MKLYTENDLKKAIESARENSFGSDFQRWLTKSEESIMEKLTPIEFPSYDNIKDESMKHYDNNGADYYFEIGAKWMRDKIGGNK
jgi:hypothetical protein